MGNEDVGFLIKNIHNSIEKGMNANLKNKRLTSSQIRILEYLHEKEQQRATQKELEEAMKVSHPTIVGLLKRLEAKGLIETQLVQENGKMMKYVWVTPYDAQLRLEAEEHRQKMEENLTRGMSEEEKKTLIRLLKMILSNSKNL